MGMVGILILMRNFRLGFGGEKGGDLYIKLEGFCLHLVGGV